MPTGGRRGVGAGVAHFVREAPIDEGTSNDHPADAQRPNGLSRGAAALVFVYQTALEQADQSGRPSKLSTVRWFSAARDVTGQRGHRAGVLDVVEMLLRQIGAHDLRPCVAR